MLFSTIDPPIIDPAKKSLEVSGFVAGFGSDSK